MRDITDKEFHDALGRQGRREAIDLLSSGFGMLARDLLQKNGAITPDIMGEAMIRAGVALMLELEPVDQVFILLLGLTAELKKKTSIAGLAP